MAMPEYGEFVSVAQLYAKRDDGADVALGSYATPQVIWRLTAGPNIDTSQIYIDQEHMRHVMRIARLGALQIQGYTGDQMLASMLEEGQVLTEARTTEPRPGELNLSTHLTVSLDEASIGRATAANVITKDMPLTKAWATAVNGGLHSGLFTSILMRTPRLHAKLEDGGYLETPILHTDTRASTE